MIVIFIYFFFSWDVGCKVKNEEIFVPKICVYWKHCEWWLCLRSRSMFCMPILASPNSRFFYFDMTSDVIDDSQVKSVALPGRFTYRDIE